MSRISLSLATGLLAVAMLSGNALAQLPGGWSAARKQHRTAPRLRVAPAVPSVQLRSSVSQLAPPAKRMVSRGLSKYKVKPPAVIAQSSKGTLIPQTNSLPSSLRKQLPVIGSKAVPARRSAKAMAGKAIAHKLSPASSLRIPSLDRAKLGPQPEPPDLPTKLRSRVESIKSLGSASAAGKLELSKRIKALSAASAAGKQKVVPPLKLGKPALSKSKLEQLQKLAGKHKANVSTKPTGSENEPRPKGTVTVDEEGNWTDFDGTYEEQMAYNNGGSYTEHTEAGGVWEVRVTPDGTEYYYTSPAGTGPILVGSERHEFVAETPDAGDAGWDLPWWAGFIPLPQIARSFRRGDVLPSRSGYLIPADSGAAAIPGVVVSPGDMPGDTDLGLTRFTERLLLVRNNSGEPAVVSLQFRTQDASGQWRWLPAEPGASQDALAFELAAGQEGCLEHDGVPISASRVRIWARSASHAWNDYQDRDLWLVSEADAGGQRAYYAEQMETFPFVIE